MQFFDINCMIGEWGYKDLQFKTAEALQQEMERVNIDKALVFHSRSWLYDPKSGNDTIIKEVQGYNGLIPVITLTSLIDQEFGGKDSIYDYISKNRIGAIRLFPNDHSYTLNLWNIDKLFCIMEEVRMPVLIECRPNTGSIDEEFPRIFEIAKKYQNTPIILLSTGYRRQRVIYDLFEKCSNIYIDTSTFITFRGIEEVVNHFGSERILFGTRMPFIEAGVSIGRVLYSDISLDSKENIAGRNIRRLLQNNRLFKGEMGGLI